MTPVSSLHAARRAASFLGGVLLAGAVSLGPVAVAAWSGRDASVAQAAVSAAPAFASPGLADVSVANVGTIARAAGTAVTVEVAIDANNVTPDAASALLTFDARYLEVPPEVVSDPDRVRVDTQSDIVSSASVDNSQGTAYYAIGRNGAPWGPGQFLFLRLPMRVKAAVPDSIAALSIGLVSSSGGNTNATDVAASGVSVFSGQAQAGQVQFVGPTATPAPSPSASATPVPSATPTQTPNPALTPVPTRTPPDVPEQSGPPAGVVPTNTPFNRGGGSNQGNQGNQGSQGNQGNQGGSSGTSGNQGGQAAQPTATPAPLAPPAQVGSGRPAVSEVPQSTLPPLPAAAQVAVFPVAPGFEQFYAERQGLRVLGNTLTAPSTENGRSVQYFEKGRLEDHPEETNLAWRFQYGLLVDELAAARAGIPIGGEASTLTYAAVHLLSLPELRAVPPAAPAGATGGVTPLPNGSVFVPFSPVLEAGPGQVVPAIFWAYVNDPALFPGGWLHDVGLPMTAPVEAVVDKGPNRGRRVLIQAFQRTVLTYDLLNPADFQIERANVGTDYARVFPEKFGG